MKRQLDFKEKLLRFVKVTKKNTDKHVFIALPIAIILMYSAIWLSRPNAQAVQVITDQAEEAVFSATFAGDIMLGRNVEKITQRNGEEHLFRYVKEYITDVDYSTANFEHPVLNEHEKYEEQEKYIHLKTNEKSVEVLKNIGFTALTAANNHAMDYLEDGVLNTINAFEKYNLDFVGIGKDIEDASEILYNDYDGMTVATLGFTDSLSKGSTANENKAGVLPAKPEFYIPLIAEAQEKADLVMVHVHWGIEYDNSISKRQESIGRAMADAGADFIIGHHPHVLQPVEIYNGTVIFNSLGNFVFDQGWSKTRETAIAQYRLDENGIGTVELTPLIIKEATPMHLGIGKTYFKSKIFGALKRESNIDFVEKDGKLSFQVNHSHVIDSKDKQ